MGVSAAVALVAAAGAVHVGEQQASANRQAKRNANEQAKQIKAQETKLQIKAENDEAAADAAVARDAARNSQRQRISNNRSGRGSGGSSTFLTGNVSNVPPPGSGGKTFLGQ